MTGGPKTPLENVQRSSQYFKKYVKQTLITYKILELLSPYDNVRIWISVKCVQLVINNCFCCRFWKLWPLHSGYTIMTIKCCYTNGQGYQIMGYFCRNEWNFNLKVRGITSNVYYNPFTHFCRNCIFCCTHMVLEKN